MTNSEKLIEAFVESLGVEKEQVSSLDYLGIPEWDSVGHMTLISTIEVAFDIMLDTDDIIDLSSFEKSKEILGKYDVEF